MSEEVNTAESKKKAGADAFRKRRSAARKYAMQFLYGLDLRKAWEYSDDSLANFREMTVTLEDDEGIPCGEDCEKAAEYMSVLIKGVTEHIEAIDEMIRQAAKNWRLERMSAVDRCILRIATYEMAYVEKVSGATAINEAIELAKVFGQADTPRFVNGVLDKVCRSLEESGKEDAVAPDEPKMAAENGEAALQQPAEAAEGDGES